MSLNYTNSIPLHIQLKAKIEDKIYKEVYHEKIPSERELMEEYYVSRSTVRQAVDQLVKDGIVEKRPGRGTFIVMKPISDWLGNLSTTSDTIKGMGLTPTIQLVKSEIIELDEFLQRKTGLNKAYHFKRIRYANNIPIGIERHYYPIHLGKELVKFNLNKESFYELLERELQVKALDAEQLITASTPTDEDAEILQISKHSSILDTERLITDINENFVEFEQAYYRSDMYSFRVSLSRKANN